LGLQALESLPAVDGPQGRPRLRALAGDPDGPPRDPDRHAHPPRQPPARPHPAAHARLEDGPRDHGRLEALRPGRPRALRLRALPDRHLRDLQPAPGAFALCRMRGGARLPVREKASGRLKTRGILTVVFAVAIAVVATVFIRSLVPPE